MYAFAQESEHDVWKEWWYALTLRVSLQANFYMTWKDQVFVANVVVIDPMQEIVVSSVISQPTGVTMELNAIAKIYKYSRFHKGHHFILMAMEVHGTPKCDMDRFIK